MPLAQGSAKLFLFWVFETASPCVAQAGLELMIYFGLLSAEIAGVLHHSWW
jgi:hypothetical protein